MTSKKPPPLLQLKNVWRSYPAGEEPIHALKNVSLKIEPGEMVAIIGQSGSGKSTLMNILGCLDRPTQGGYRVAGKSVKRMGPDDLAALRREHFGFIFQRYHLLGDLDAVGNVEMPAVYAGKPPIERRRRAKELLGRLGLSDRLDHRPSELSGGQQQRVSVARALMNGGEVILADEPTGALDTRSGAEMLKILKELNAEGHTIIIVTHDPKVAAHARRIIEISDGEIVSDRPNLEAGPAPTPKTLKRISLDRSWIASLDRMREALQMALVAMNAHKLRTTLTMLGIIIGIFSVVTILAVVSGGMQTIMSTVGDLGSDTITIYPGSQVGDERASRIATLRADDARALARLPYVEAASPLVSTARSVRRGSESGGASIQGVDERFMRIQNLKLERGRWFTAGSVASSAQEVVIDANAAKRLFKPNENPIGESILLGSVPARVVGVTAEDEGLFAGMMGNQLRVWAPYTMVMSRLSRQTTVQQITIKLDPSASPAAAEKAIVQFLTARHGEQDFTVVTSAVMQEVFGQIQLIGSAFFGLIGGISLLVGGIGVMNIMLVSVSERTREIGVRTAVGARQSDIMTQFMIEAVLVCLIGGAVGLLLSMFGGWVFGLFVKQFQLVYSPAVMFGAFAISTLIGLAFGWMPASSAAKLDPVDALARE